MGLRDPEAMQTSRLSEAETAALSAQITAYIRETPGVREVENVRFAVAGRRLSWSCEVLTDEGKAAVSYETAL